MQKMLKQKLPGQTLNKRQKKSKMMIYKTVN